MASLVSSSISGPEGHPVTASSVRILESRCQCRTLPCLPVGSNPSSFTVKPRCSTSWGQATGEHCVPPLATEAPLCSQGHSLKNQPHVFQGHQGFDSVACGCRIRIRFSGEFIMSILFSTQRINTRQHLNHRCAGTFPPLTFVQLAHQGVFLSCSFAMRANILHPQERLLK